MRGADISVVIITKDEASDIADCIASVPPGARVLVYDADSTDRTQEIARALGAQVTSAPWQGFALARERAAELVTTPWTFMLDADERFTPDLRTELADLQPSDQIVAYSVARRNHLCGRWIKSAGWWPDRLVRLMRTGQATIATRNGGTPTPHAVHETWQPRGACGRLLAPLDHFSYPSTAEYRRKFALYTGLEACGVSADVAGVIVAWLVVPARAAWFWLFRGGIAEGWQGAYACAGSALYPAVVATKSWLRRARAASP